MSSQFDQLAPLYEEFSQAPFRRYLEIPSVLQAVGALKGLRVLDLGCGSGIYSRLLAEQGADAVVGMDEADGMVAHARRAEEREPKGITYVAGALPEAMVTSFDIVLGVYVLPYATTYKELTAMCRTAARALRPGGRFVTLPVNPAFHPDPDYYASYGFRMYDHGSRGDGAPLGLDLRFGQHDEHVVARLWSTAALCRALTGCGFGAPAQRSHLVTDDAPVGFGADYLRVPHALILDAVKGEEL
ncbi:class I SAM-dependent methyltransferase [Streptomyces sp. NPDC047985]|uniref:class I SAM-dependent methyltransferase n=1 Tax=unclassified Streptomyces TaxID=2593676 RepID=UPI0034370FC7